MGLNHVIQRGKWFHYCCRVPSDLLHFFPSPIIWKSLKTTDKKIASIIATSYEHRTQSLFMQLRSGMLDANLEKHLVASFLLKGAKWIEAQSTDSEYFGDSRIISPLDKMFDAEAKKQVGDKAWVDIFVEYYGSFQPTTQKWTTVLEKEINRLREYLKHRNENDCPFNLGSIAKELKRKGVKVTKTELNRLGLLLTNAKIQLIEAQMGCRIGNWSALQSIQQSAEKNLQTPYVDFNTVINEYLDFYQTDNLNLAAKTFDKVTVECRVLLEVLGNIGIATVNSHEELTKLKKTLLKYPLNKFQAFGNKSVHSIKGYNGPYIAPKTANNYISRIACIIDFAKARKYVVHENVFRLKAKFQYEKMPDEERQPYDKADMQKLVDALCTKDLWTYGLPRPERFWIILVGIFTGLRTSNIVTLTKEQIKVVEDRSGNAFCIIDLKRGKTANTVRPVAIPDILILLGFLDWVQSLEREKLFQDSPESFGRWYNRDEQRNDGYHVQGFESKYITTDKKKCFYSLRHSFAAEINYVSPDYKAVIDLMGHSAKQFVTARYTGLTKPEKLKEIADKMDFEGLDLDKLEKRARELFPCKVK